MNTPQAMAAQTREHLLERALAIVEERGGAGLTLAELASRAGVSIAHVHRLFESRDALLEALVDHWFQPKVALMEEIVAADLPARRKMYEFFARRFVRYREFYRSDPAAFAMYVEIGDEHFEMVRGYVDLADHYLGVIIGEAMSEGHFAGFEVDEVISLVNQMLSLYCNMAMMPYVMDKLSEDKLARIIDAVFDGLCAQDRGARGLTGLRAA